MKMAMIGVGRWGSVLLREFKKQTEVKYECDSKTDLDKIFADPEIEAVAIATPTETHFKIASIALDARKHVFLEKPGTMGSKDLGDLVDKAEKLNLKFAIGYEFPHHPAVQKLREVLRTEKIEGLYFDWQKWGTFTHDSIPHLLSHDVSIMKFLGIEPRFKSCKKTKIISSDDILETEFENNIKSTINRVSPNKHKALVVLTKKDNFVWNNQDLFRINKETKELVRIDLPDTTPVEAEIKDFLSAIKESRPPLSSGSFAIEVYKIIESVQV